MSEVLRVQGLCKTYPEFHLDNVSFALEKGRIMGFIGRNGAGKTTTLKSLLNFVHPDSGSISFFGKSFHDSEMEIKQRIGFVSGGIDYYSRSKIKTISQVTKRLYPSWDESAYKRYMDMFALSEKKTPAELSAGMKVKYSLALALSHKAELLILDEPTSGLDPVSREDLLDVFLELEDQGVSILFSTHITSDLDKCADDITYIQGGKIIVSCNTNSFIDRYRLLELTDSQLTPELSANLIGLRRSKIGHTALISSDYDSGLPTKAADLEAIMVHMEKQHGEGE